MGVTPDDLRALGYSVDEGAPAVYAVTGFGRAWTVGRDDQGTLTNLVAVVADMNAASTRTIIAQKITELEAADKNWATLTAIGKSDAMRLCVRLVAALSRLVLRRFT